MDKKVITIISILIFITLAGTAVFGFQKKRQKIQMQNEKEHFEQRAEEFQQTQVEQIDTSDWKTYRNKEYGFEVKYPEGWVYEERHYKDDQMSDVVAFGEKNCAEEYNNVMACDHNALVDIYNTGEYLEGDILNDSFKCTEKIPLLNFMINVSEILACRHFSSLGFISDDYIFSANGLDFVLSISKKDSKYDEDIDPNYNSIIERAILESFRFADNNKV